MTGGRRPGEAQSSGEELLRKESRRCGLSCWLGESINEQFLTRERSMFVRAGECGKSPKNFVARWDGGRRLRWARYGRGKGDRTQELCMQGDGSLPPGCDVTHRPTHCHSLPGLRQLEEGEGPGVRQTEEGAEGEGPAEGPAEGPEE